MKLDDKFGKVNLSTYFRKAAKRLRRVLLSYPFSDDHLNDCIKNEQLK